MAAQERLSLDNEESLPHVVFMEQTELPGEVLPILIHSFLVAFMATELLLTVQ